ncbi:MAG: hypothetical protein ABFD18_08050 [Syntrophomonas sp.]
MRQWRVGTFSMGLLLLCAGVGMLYAQFQPGMVVSGIMKWWPVIFIILGIEVLLQGYLKKDEESRIKYDVFSIFIIFVIVMSGLGLEAASKVGLDEFIQENITAEHFNIESNREIAMDKDVKKVVIEADGAPRLKIRSGSGDSIQCRTQAEIRAQSEAQGQQLLHEKTQFNTRKNGNTLYLNLGSGMGDNCYNTTYSLILPERLAVEIDHRDASLQIVSGQIASDWFIRGDGELNITLASKSDLILYALVPQSLNIKGNLSWVTPEGQLLKTKAQGNSSTVEYQASASGNQITVNTNEEEHGEESIQARAQLGSGRNKMTIIHQGGEITVNQLP